MPLADNTGGAGYPDDDAHLDLKPLARLGAWGAGALAALAVAVMAAQSDLGGRRAGTAYASLSGASLTGAAHDQAVRNNGTELLARADAERESRRLAEAVRMLAGDRDRLAGRVALLERNLDDLTGSVARVAAQPRSPAEPAAKPAEPPPAVAAPQTSPANPAPLQVAPVPAAPPPAASLADSPTAWGPQPNIPMPPYMGVVTPLWREHADLPVIPPKVAAKNAREPDEIETTPLPHPGPVAVLQSYAEAGSSSSAAGAEAPAALPGRQAALPAPAINSQTAPRLEYAIDLGAAPNLAGLRSLWERVRIRQPASLGGLRPLVSVRDGAKPGSTELRLVAGPLADTNAVARVCAALLSVGIACQPAVFDGQRLPNAEALRPRPSVPAPHARPPS
jgi:hypothetical protein